MVGCDLVAPRKTLLQQTDVPPAWEEVPMLHCLWGGPTKECIETSRETPRAAELAEAKPSASRDLEDLDASRTVAATLLGEEEAGQELQ